jgi:G:T-mismatch repair DNA endonuclease (very short patch repair protein)
LSIESAQTLHTCEIYRLSLAIKVKGCLLYMHEACKLAKFIAYKSKGCVESARTLQTCEIYSLSLAIKVRGCLLNMHEPCKLAKSFYCLKELEVIC